jgi:hypothetical protein
VDIVDGLGSVVLVVEVVGFVVEAVAVVVGALDKVEAVVVGVVDVVVGVVEVGLVVGVAEVVGWVVVAAGGVVATDVAGGVYCEVVAAVVVSEPEEQLKPTSIVITSVKTKTKYVSLGFLMRA